jgi:RHS repeat-associated protein
LKSVAEYQNGQTQTGNQSYNYDRFGNRTIDGAANKTWGANINIVQTAPDQSNNRMYAPNDPSHNQIDCDAAGNQTKDYLTSNGTRVFDAENRMKSATDSGNHTSTYSYDGDGRRVKRNIGGTETWQVYGFGGELLAEYAANTSATSPQKEYGYRNGELLVTAEAPSAARTNVALAANDGVASSSSNYNDGTYSYTAAGVTNGVRSGSPAVTGEAWNGATGTFPQWVQVDFNGSKSIDEIDVFTVQDNWENPSEPTESMTFSNYGLTGFDVQYWNGSSWVTVPGGSITSNNKVWKKITFSAITTTKIRVVTNAAPDGYSRITELEAWTAASGGTANIQWLVSDHLGTPRMVFDQTGSLANVSRHDYLPFGEELLAGTGGRTTAQGYTLSDNVRQKFTSKERDNETGLDYFGARYYSSTQGRFASADPLGGQIVNPQSINKYVYVCNSPLRLTDPTGMYVCADGKKCDSKEDKEFHGLNLFVT